MCQVQQKPISQMKEDGILVGLATGRGLGLIHFSHGQSGSLRSPVMVNSIDS